MFLHAADYMMPNVGRTCQFGNSIPKDVFFLKKIFSKLSKLRSLKNNFFFWRLLKKFKLEKVLKRAYQNLIGDN
jgi:hypothetical protein